MGKNLRITLIRSGIGRPKKHKTILKSLGFSKLHQTVIRPDRPDIWGMIQKIPHLVRVEREDGGQA